MTGVRNGMVAPSDENFLQFGQPDLNFVPKFNLFGMNKFISIS